jgi:hypothetical protein
MTPSLDDNLAATHAVHQDIAVVEQQATVRSSFGGWVEGDAGQSAGTAQVEDRCKPLLPPAEGLDCVLVSTPSSSTSAMKML